ncbi:MAG: NADAR family protein [Pseudanabaena sp.]
MPAVAKLPESRTYNRLECITFRKTAEKFGGLSNMAGGYLLNVNGVKILTSEALYQACRFPHLPEVQRLIIAERSPMTAKMKSKPYRDNSRVDWDIVRTKVMRWCLQVKLVQNWEKFSELLLETGDLPIVEDSRKDDFWGAKPEDEEILTGANVLGRLLMQVREQIKTGEITSETIVKPLPIQNFLLYGQEISSVSANSEYHLDNYRDLLDFNKVNNQPDSEVVLPDTPMLESDFNGKNTINSHVSAESIESEHQKYDASQIMMPYIIGSLKTERTDKELVELFENTDLKIMRKWLDRAVELGKVRKLSKPVRYIAESQLTLIN